MERCTIMATNGHALAMAGQFMIFCWNVCPVNEQKADILFRCSIKNFQPGLMPNTNKKLMKSTSAMLLPMRLLVAGSNRFPEIIKLFFISVIPFFKRIICLIYSKIFIAIEIFNL